MVTCRRDAARKAIHVCAWSGMTRVAAGLVGRPLMMDETLTIVFNQVVALDEQLHSLWKASPLVLGPTPTVGLRPVCRPEPEEVDEVFEVLRIGGGVSNDGDGIDGNELIETDRPVGGLLIASTSTSTLTSTFSLGPCCACATPPSTVLGPD